MQQFLVDWIVQETLKHAHYVVQTLKSTENDIENESLRRKGSSIKGLKEERK